MTMRKVIPINQITIQYYYSVFSYHDFMDLFYANIRAVQNQWYGVEIDYMECHPNFFKDMFSQRTTVAARHEEITMQPQQPTLLGSPVKLDHPYTYQLVVHFKARSDD